MLTVKTEKVPFSNKYSFESWLEILTDKINNILLTVLISIVDNTKNNIPFDNVDSFS